MGLVLTAEKIQQITDIILPTDDEIVYYSIQKVPDVHDSNIPISALNIAIEEWNLQTLE